ncbi:MAG: DUF1638 domain-containing protein [Deltaproteobacteria bacterium]|nr:DUF1638 domain-containing protein [Deltaproteobacteria bacterium]
MIAFIGCDIFRDEIEWVLSRHPEIQTRAKWLQAGLHNDMNILEQRLGQALAEEAEKGPQDLRLLIGNGCLPQMSDLAKEKNLPLLNFKNCLEAILGLEKLRELEQGRTMVITPSWIRRAWFAPEGMRALLGWDNTDFRQNFGRYDRILVLDPGFEPLTDLEILEAFEIIEVPIEVEPLSLENFEKVIVDFFN